ncbi:MAG TPA: translocase [Archaeoglobus profundus]|nr:translocase [Archaeoglobus profundus]
MFGWSELALILILALILLGPDKLADVARTLGRIYGEYQKAKRRLELEIMYGYEIPTKEKIEEIMRKKIEEINIDLRKSLNNEEIYKVGGENNDRINRS